MKNKEPVRLLLEKMLDRQLGNVQNDWPPKCYGLFYQPKRPIKKQ
jgi:hypothetical protein